MKKISVFNHVTIDGFFAGPNGEIDWFQAVHDDEWNRYAQEHADLSHNTLMFGHTTYQMMKSWWPTPTAMKTDPHMAEVMNNSPKIVFSRSLQSVDDEPNWKNTRVFRQMDQGELRNLKREEDITILGSGTIVQQLANLGLIDEYVLIVVPIILGEGKPLFKDVPKTNLRLVEQRAFRNGIVLLRYQPYPS
ncbi:MAG: dihydrofolate reductase family protein [Anaerolineae bacterium]|jgi:dihydrofolate reductase|nr:dihydrofolate reductase family protein [Anaerolineae bacterium]